MAKDRVGYCKPEGYWQCCGSTDFFHPNRRQPDCFDREKAIWLLVPKPALDTQVGGDHYKALAIQPVQYIHANNIPFIEGSVIKYVTRWRTKGGIADLEKARHFLDLLIELERKRQDERVDAIKQFGASCTKD